MKKKARVGTRARLAVAVWGDAVAGRPLVLLLWDAGYDARFLPASSAPQPASLEGTDLLLLTPTPGLGTEHRQALFASLREAPETAAMPVLELVSSSEEPPEGGARDGSWHAVPWPCKIDELERKIALLADAPIVQRSDVATPQFARSP